MAAAIRDSLRLEAIVADVASDDKTALKLLTVTEDDVAVLDRDIPRPSADEVARSIVASASGTPILAPTAVDRLEGKATGFGPDVTLAPRPGGGLVVAVRPPPAESSEDGERPGGRAAQLASTAG